MSPTLPSKSSQRCKDLISVCVRRIRPPVWSSPSALFGSLEAVWMSALLFPQPFLKWRERRWVVGGGELGGLRGWKIGLRRGRLGPAVLWALNESRGEAEGGLERESKVTGFTLDPGAPPPSGLWVSAAAQARVFSFSSGKAPLASALMSKLSYCVHPLVLNLFFLFFFVVCWSCDCLPSCFFFSHHFQGILSGQRSKWSFHDDGLISGLLLGLLLYILARWVDTLRSHPSSISSALNISSQGFGRSRFAPPGVKEKSQIGVSSFGCVFLSCGLSEPAVIEQLCCLNPGQRSAGCNKAPRTTKSNDDSVTQEREARWLPPS